jgi:hypothetical protein
LGVRAYDGAAVVAGGKIVFVAGVDNQQPMFPGLSKAKLRQRVSDVRIG